MSHLLYSDNPIRSDSEDELQTATFVARLVEPLLDWPAETSLVVGLYAPWGTGKTSTLNLLQHRLRSPRFRDRAEVVRFNPWLYQDSDSLLRAFFNTLFEATRKTPLLTPARKRGLGKAIKGIGNFITPILAAPVQAHYGGPDLLTPAVGAVTSIAEASLTGGEASFEEQKQKASKVLLKLGKADHPARIVVLIDDLDRAEVREVHAMLKLVRLIADLPNVTYVIAMDYDRVRDLLESDSRGSFRGQYLEKIIQVPIQMPPVPRQRLRALIWEGINAIAQQGSASIEAGQDVFRVNEHVISDLVMWRVRTLRDRARLLNTYRFLMLSGHERLELDATDALLISFLRAFYPWLADRIHRNKGILVQGESALGLMLQYTLKEDARRQARAEAISLLVRHSPTPEAETPPERTVEIDFGNSHFGNESLRQETSRLRSIVLRLFPYAEETRFPDHDERRQWRLHNMIASPERFDRYFSFIYEDDSVADQEVVQWLRDALHDLESHPSLTTDEDWRERAQNLFAVIGAFNHAKQGDMRSRIADRLEDVSPANLAGLGTAAAFASEQGLFDESHAAQLVRDLLASLRGRFNNPSGMAPVELSHESLLELEAELHNALAKIVQNASNPFDAVVTAEQHFGFWSRLYVKDGTSPNEALPCRKVLDAGLEQAHGILPQSWNVFTGYDNPGQAVWRWRDLLRYADLQFTPIIEYLRTTIRENAKFVPDLLGLFAGWSDAVPSMNDRGGRELREAVDEIFGWQELCDAVDDYKVVAAEGKIVHRYSQLVGQFENIRRVMKARDDAAAPSSGPIDFEPPDLA